MPGCLLSYEPLNTTVESFSAELGHTKNAISISEHPVTAKKRLSSKSQDSRVNCHMHRGVQDPSSVPIFVM